MKAPILNENDAIIPTDFTGKAEKIMELLGESVFNFNPNDLYEEVKGDMRKRTIKMGEVNPTLTATKVACKLDELFFTFEPIDNPEDITPKDYTDGFIQFMRLMTYVNGYVIMTASKQLYCGFVGITVEDYNKMLTSQIYAPTFKRIDDRLVSANLISAESGLLSEKTITNKLEAKDIGFSMKKADEGGVFIVQAKIDREAISANLEKWKNQIPGKKK